VASGVRPHRGGHRRARVRPRWARRGRVARVAGPAQDRAPRAAPPSRHAARRSEAAREARSPSSRPKLARTRRRIWCRAKQVRGCRVLAARLDGLDPDGCARGGHATRSAAVGIILLGSAVDGKVSLGRGRLQGPDEALPGRRLVQEIAKMVGGGEAAARTAQAGGQGRRGSSTSPRRRSRAWWSDGAGVPRAPAHGHHPHHVPDGTAIPPSGDARHRRGRALVESRATRTIRQPRFLCVRGTPRARSSATRRGC